jgi:hypothetical protein
MTLERILVGDDRIELVKRLFPYIPDAEVEFVETPEQVVERALAGGYTVIVTDLDYTPRGREGFKVLEALKGVPARKVLYTGAAQEPGVKERAKELGAETLDKDELGALVGQVVSKAPLKEGGKVLLCVPYEEPLHKAFEAVMELFYPDGSVKVGTDLQAELATGDYGLVIDATMIAYDGRKAAHGRVAHDLKYMRLAEVPRVVVVNDVCTAVVDIMKHVARFYKKKCKE